MSEKERHLEVLGLPPNASRARIELTYRHLVELWHPNRFQHRGKSLRIKAARKLEEIESAYQYLLPDADYQPIQYDNQAGFSKLETGSSANRGAEQQIEEVFKQQSPKPNQFSNEQIFQNDMHISRETFDFKNDQPYRPGVWDYLKRNDTLIAILGFIFFVALIGIANETMRFLIKEHFWMLVVVVVIGLVLYKALYRKK